MSIRRRWAWCSVPVIILCLIALASSMAGESRPHKRSGDNWSPLYRKINVLGGKVQSNDAWRKSCCSKADVWVMADGIPVSRRSPVRGNGLEIPPYGDRGQRILKIGDKEEAVLKALGQPSQRTQKRNRQVLGFPLCDDTLSNCDITLHNGLVSEITVHAWQMHDCQEPIQATK